VSGIGENYRGERERATRGRKDYLNDIPQQQDAGAVVEENARQRFEMEVGERVRARVEEYKKGRNNLTELVEELKKRVRCKKGKSHCHLYCKIRTFIFLLFVGQVVIFKIIMEFEINYS
jgi:hypothetical protein